MGSRLITIPSEVTPKRGAYTHKRVPCRWGLWASRRLNVAEQNRHRILLSAVVDSIFDKFETYPDSNDACGLKEVDIEPGTPG